MFFICLITFMDMSLYLPLLSSLMMPIISLPEVSERKRELSCDLGKYERKLGMLLSLLKSMFLFKFIASEEK